MSACWYLSRIKWLRPVSFLLLASGMLVVCPAQADHLQDIRTSGVLRWGADAEGGAPYVYPDPQSPERLVGFESELAEALAAKLAVKARMVQNQWDQLIPALERGNFDIILNGLEITPQNQQRIAMSLPYFAYAQQLVTRRDTEGLTNLDVCKGKRIGVLSYSAAQRLVEKMTDASMVIYPGNVESFRDLKAKRIDVVVLDLPIAIYYAKPDPDLKLSGGAFAPGYYGVGLRKEDATLSAAINKAITELSADGTLERIYRKYGLWDARQEHLGDYQPEQVTERKTISTLREWPKYLPVLLQGAVVTIWLSVLSMMLAVVVGMILALARLYGIAPLRWAARAYVEVVRGTPLLIQLFLIYYGLPQIGLKLNAALAAILGLGLNYAASEAENYRAGIQAVPVGQAEASQALGMSRWQSLRHIILPQALPLVIPPVSNDFIAMFKDSSLVSVITMMELTKKYGILAMATDDFIGVGLMTAAIYFAMSYPASLLAHRLERKLRHDRR